MKLNNHGWGTKEFIFSIVAILILLLVVAVNVHRLYNALDDTSYSTNNSTDTNTNNNTNNNNNNNNNNSNDNTNNNNANDNSNTNGTSESEEVAYSEKYYKDYQNKMINATRNYIIYSNSSIPNEGLKVDLSTLVNKNYINSLNDMLDNSPCNGYSIVSINSDSSLNIKTYLSCSNYVTEGY